MHVTSDQWKWPVALAMVVCSLVPTALLILIDHLELHDAMWLVKHQIIPSFAETFLAYHRLGWFLPIVTTGVAVWVVTGERVSASRLAWVVLLLVVLHLFWLSCGIFAFYLVNQNFNV